MPTPKPIDILLVEDNPADVRLAQETLKEYKLENQRHVVQNGESALAFLRRQAPYFDAPRPDLVLLDLTLPRMDGGEAIMEIRKDNSLRDLPVVVMAATQLDKNMLAYLKVTPDCFILKPLTIERYLDAIRCFPQLALRIVKIAGA